MSFKSNQPIPLSESIITMNKNDQSNIILIVLIS